MVNDDDDEGDNGDDAGDDRVKARMVDVDIMEGGLISLGLGVPPLLSEPHDQPYPTQPYITKLLQFHSFTNPNTILYKFPTVDTGDDAMGRGMPCQGHHTTVWLYNV